MRNDLTNALYVKKQFYVLQVEENIDFIEQVNKFNMLEYKIVELLSKNCRRTLQTPFKHIPNGFRRKGKEEPIKEK